MMQAKIKEIRDKNQKSDPMDAYKTKFETYKDIGLTNLIIPSEIFNRKAGKIKGRDEESQKKLINDIFKFFFYGLDF